MTPPTLAPLEHHEIPQGTPLPFPIFDENATLLCGEGHIIANEREFEALREISLFRYPEWPARPISRPALPHGLGAPETFEKIQLSAGDVLFARKTTPPAHEFVTTRLLGWKKDHELRLDFCAQVMEPGRYQAGEELEIKLIRDPYVVAFSSQIISPPGSHASSLLLQYPQAIACRILRKNLRSNVSLPVSTSRKNGVMCHDGVLSNISASGGLLEVNQLFASSGSEILLTLPLPAHGSEYLLELHARIRNLQTSESDHVPVVQYGLEFIGTTEAEQLLLEQYVFQSLL